MRKVILQKTEKLEKEQKQKTETTCYGCLNDIANQLGHMEEGGCLYQE